MMVVFTTHTKGHALGYFLVRGMMVIFAGTLVDVFIWKIIPFMTADVLYLIGLSLPLAYLFLKIRTLPRWAFVVLILGVTPILQNILRYTDYPAEYSLWGEPTAFVANPTSIFNHWVIDGWFPIFPWLGFSFLGVNLALLRWKSNSNSFKKNITLWLGISLLILGIVIWVFHPTSLSTRDGYSELFYPPTLAYIIAAVGIIVVLFWSVDRSVSVILYRPLQALGESALFMYMLHLAIIEYILIPLWPRQSFQAFLLIYIGLAFFLILIAVGLKALKTTWKDRPYVIRFLLGG
jgi:uncharacterized membrane protein